MKHAWSLRALLIALIILIISTGFRGAQQGLAAILASRPAYAQATCDPGNGYEANESFGQACEINVPANLDLEFTKGDRDVFRVFLEPGDLTVQVFGTVYEIPGDPPEVHPGDTVVSVYQASGGNVQIASSGPSVDHNLSVAVADSGYYYVEVTDAVTCDTCQWDYKLKLGHQPSGGGGSDIQPDSYEENDSLAAAREISRNTSLDGLTIAPAYDPDYYYFLGVKGPVNITVYSAFGVKLTMQLIGPGGGVMQQVNKSTSPVISTALPGDGFYTILVNVAPGEGDGLALYQLHLSNDLPTPTPIPPPTTPTPTVDVGGKPDIAEPNNTFDTAFRIAPGNTLNLNFNSGIEGVADIDYFMMIVKPDVTYTCETAKLGLGTDTILSVYGPDTATLIGLNDDINSSTGNIGSRVTWKSTYDGPDYIEIRQNGDLDYPGAATYLLGCDTGTSSPTGGLPTGGSGGGGSVPPSGGSGSSSGVGADALRIDLIGVPQVEPTPTPGQTGALFMDVIIGYDANSNGLIDLDEGVSGVSVRAVDPATNRQVASGFTDVRGGVKLLITGPLGNNVLVVVPFFSIGRTYQVGQVAVWQVILPPATLPGLIP